MILCPDTSFYVGVILRLAVEQLRGLNCSVDGVSYDDTEVLRVRALFLICFTNFCLTPQLLELKLRS